MNIYIDADACPVKDEVYRVAQRHGAEVHVVSNTYLQVPRFQFIRQTVVDAGPDEADNWIAERAGEGDVVITGDIPLAERCLNSGAKVLKHDGKAFTEANIASAIATRALMEQLRSTGDQVGGGPPFTARDRSSFLQALHETCVMLKRG